MRSNEDEGDDGREEEHNSGGVQDKARDVVPTRIQPEEIGVEFTEGDMMEPEASVSALVFHRPDARYFGD